LPLEHTSTPIKQTLRNLYPPDKIGECEMNNKEKMNPKRTARIAGLLYLLIAIFGIFSMLYGPESHLVPRDATATADNIAAAEPLYRLAFLGDLLGQVIFVFLVLLLYRLLKPVDKNIAVLMVVLVLVGVPIAMLNDLNQMAALLLSTGAGYLTIFAADQLSAQAMFHLDLYQHGLRIAYIFWGLWLFPLGYLVFRSGFLPRVLGVLLIIAGCGYLIEFVAFFLFPSANLTIRMFTFWGEVLFALWLLIMGVNVEKWEGRVLETA
jgi:hypothetical protein